MLRGYFPVVAIYYLLTTLAGEAYTAIYPIRLSYFLYTSPHFPPSQMMYPPVLSIYPFYLPYNDSKPIMVALRTYSDYPFPP